MKIQSTSPIMNLLPQASPQRGFSLIELMISITLGLILLLGVLQILDSTRQANRTNDALGQLQENGRLALEFLSRDIRLAGNAGCNRSTQLEILGLPEVISTHYVKPVGDVKSLTKPLEAPSSIQGLPSGTPLGSNTVPAPTEGLFLFGMDTGSTSLTQDMALQTSQIKFRAGGSWRKGDLLLLSDCLMNGTLADAFAAPANNDGTAGVILPPRTLPERLQVRYPEFAILGSVFARQFFIGDLDGDGIRSLYRRDLANADVRAVPLVDGVVDMRFRFGMDGPNADGLIDVYVGMAPTLNWDNVLSVEISLLLRDTFTTSAHNSTAPQTYRFPSWAAATTTPPNLPPPALPGTPDLHLYTVMGTTIALRNRTQ